MGSNSNHIDLISSLADQWSATTIGFYEQIFLLLFFFFCSWLTIRRCCGVVTINLIAHRSNMLGDMNRLNVSFDLISARSFFHHPIEWIATVYVVDRAFGRKKMRSLDCQPKIEIWIYWANNSDFNVVRNHNILKFFQNDIIRIFMRR